MKNKVVLFYPPYGGPPLGAPLCLLALASPLLESGFRVTLIDGAVVPDYEAAIAREIGDALVFGVSLLTGPSIRAATRVCRQVREYRPDLPIVFGGWHPSLVPKQTLREDFVDAVVRGQGELTFVDVVRRIADGKSLDGVRGVSHKLGQQVVEE